MPTKEEEKKPLTHVQKILIAIVAIIVGGALKFYGPKVGLAEFAEYGEWIAGIGAIYLIYELYEVFD